MDGKLIVIGGSSGGFTAARRLLGDLPTDLAAAVVVVLHVHPNVESEGLAIALGSRCSLPVVAAEDKEPLLPGKVIVASPDYHLLIEPGRVVLSTDTAVAYARPSLDVCFESAADAYAERTLGVVLSGFGRDGAAGMAAIKRRSGYAIVQDPATAAAGEMPRSVCELTTVDEVLPLDEIAPRLVTLCGHEPGGLTLDPKKEMERGMS